MGRDRWSRKGIATVGRTHRDRRSRLMKAFFWHANCVHVGHPLASVEKPGKTLLFLNISRVMLPQSNRFAAAMKRCLTLPIVLPLVLFALESLFPAEPATAQNCPPPGAITSAPPEGPSWIFRQSRYSHNPTTGERVAQFQPEKPAYPQYDPTYTESGYRHYHTALRGPDGSYDHSHIVQTWGAGEFIRPYGEWEFPFRAGATPFGPWGNPQGPWTLPFESWVNPYGLGRLPNPPWPSYGPYSGPSQGPAGAAPYVPYGGPQPPPVGPPQAYAPQGGAHQPPFNPQALPPQGGPPSPPPAPQP